MLVSMNLSFFANIAAKVNNLCRMPGNEWALRKAKEHLISNYLVVGITEQMAEFIAVLEAMVPQFFQGASKLYAEAGRKSHMRETVKKDNPSDRAVEVMRNSTVYHMERDFYDFAKVVFQDVKRRSVEFKNGLWLPLGKRYHYEKIKP